ncbi:efflux RND transporter periplasmic adaptor subunit [Desulfallas sp. Bu1-1]|uniref:efflux RND transporter periplasmic adaptor subunit n=1 Tax=Desulfallas sp. Bu1-1 TaxID=2787620 RepID=UPI001FAC6B3D|nr:efflux RND transporter periplasmic adaptor subunit [Desulfallas sp. Bu1-1]
MVSLKNKKIIAIIIVFIVLAAGAGLWFQKKGDATSAEIQYEQVQVKRDDIVVGFDSDGTIDFAKVNLRFGVKGTIAEILVAEGDEVKKGDVIAKLDDRDYQDQYQLALAKLQEAREQELTSLLDTELKLKTTAAELEQLKDEYMEMEAIPDAYSASELKMKKLELDNKDTEYQNLQQKYELQKAQGLKQNELEVKMAKEDLEETILYAPVSGIVLDLANKVGESVTDEQDFATIHENNAINAVTQVIEYDIGQIKVGQKVYVTVEAIPDKKFTGEVSKINALPSEDSSGLVNYTVEIKIKDPGTELKDGMTCAVSFVIKEVKDCLIVPYNAVKIVDGKQVVTVVDETGQSVEREIKTGFTDGTSVEVLEGLRENETVVYPKK